MTESKKTILLIDDDIDFLTQEQMQLEAAGYNVITASSIKEGIETLNNNDFDMAIVDLMLEDADGGFKLCYKIKKKDPSIPVMLVTAVASETGLEFGASTDEERSWIKADKMLTKPVRFEQLKREVKHLLKD
ncbi:MAG: response regulator [Phycisphaerae bacterium]|nr:response regulator [Phycisphaerae bacterium]